VTAFGSSSSPLGDLGKAYIGSWMGDAINLGAAVSGFADRRRRAPAPRRWPLSSSWRSPARALQTGVRDAVCAHPFNWFPWVVVAWLAVGLAIILAVPGLARRIGANLAAAEGMG
jgi:hypothetical protein